MIHSARKLGLWTKFAIAVSVAAVVLVAVAALVIRHAGAILKGRITETLSARFHSRVELDRLDVSVLRGLEVSGEGLRIYPPDGQVTAGASPPLIALQHFSFHSGLGGLFVKPMHIAAVRVSGLQVVLPPREIRRESHASLPKPRDKVKILVDEIVCDDSRLVIDTNPQVQDKVDMLSLRAQGKPELAKPGAADVKSGMKGTFALQDGTLEFSHLAYSLPAAQVNLKGVYSLDGQQFDFRGDVQTDASLSQMVDSRWASLLLRVVSPLFRRKGGGSQIPVRISGTKSAPRFGLDLNARHSVN